MSSRKSVINLTLLGNKKGGKSSRNSITTSNLNPPRDKFPLPPSGKLNLSFLIKEEKPLLKHTILDLLRRLYWPSTLYRENFEEEVLAVLLKTLKENPHLSSFDQLLTLLPPDQVPLFYKLIKGTQHYVLGKTDSGYPPLGDFFHLDPTAKGKPIQYQAASMQILNALFGDSVAANIVNKEKEKWEEKHTQKILTKKELEQFLMQCHLNLTDFSPLLSFSRPKKGKKGKFLQDAPTKVQFVVNN